MLDKAKDIRQGEELNEAALQAYLRQQLDASETIEAVKQFPGGFSNLTYLIRTNSGEYVLRRPPFGANIKSAHDMGREYRVLSMLDGHYPKIPKPTLYCEDEAVIGAPFYMMERVQGVILRNRPPKGMELGPDVMRQLSTSLIDNLVALHQLDLDKTGLGSLGKPEGYVQRQVEGWIKRYYKAETDTVESMNTLADWMPNHMPADGNAGLIHNDYKYDNLVLDAGNLAHIKAVLDWEMCTVGDTLMDLGTTLAYWVEEAEADPITTSIGNLTWLPGNLSRQELVARYAERKGQPLDDVLFYYVFGCFKIGVIIQQIYARYKAGHTKDPRFAGLLHVVKLFGQRGVKALETGSV